MREQQPIELEVHLRVTDEALNGEVKRTGQRPVRFSGWLGLFGAVEQACDRPRSASIAQTEWRRPGEKGRT
jgi:hypothetical protein